MCLNETYSEVRVCKPLSDMFPVKNTLKQGYSLLPMIFKFAWEYAIRRVQAHQEDLYLNITHELVVYADDVNILDRSVHTIQKT